MFINVIPYVIGGSDLFNRYPTLTYLWHFHLDHHRLYTRGDQGENVKSKSR